MCSRWEQRLFIRKLSNALLIAEDAVACPVTELTPIAKHFNLCGLDCAMCFITRHRNSNQQDELRRYCFGSTSARLENCPRMNPETVSVLTHFGLPCSFLLYIYTDNSSGNQPHIYLSSKGSTQTQRSTESLLQLFELLVYSAATQVRMDQLYPFLIQVPIYQQGRSATTFALRGWYKSCHMSGIINGMGLSSSFGSGEMKSCNHFQNSREDTETHSVNSLSSAHALTLLQDTRATIHNLPRYSSIGPVPLLSCYYTDVLANTSESLYQVPILPYNGYIVRRIDLLQRALSFSDLKDFVTDALGRSKSQRNIAAKNSTKAILASLSKALRVNTDEILWPLTEILPTDTNKNIYLNSIYQGAYKQSLKDQLNVTLSRIIPLDFPLTAHIPRMYLNSIATGIPSNFGSAWKIFAKLPAEAFLRGKAIESVVLHCYATDFDQEFLTIYTNILHRIRSNLERGTFVSLLGKGDHASNIDIFRKRQITDPATNIGTVDHKCSPTGPIVLSSNNYEEAYLIYIKRITEYRQSRALEHKRNTIAVGDSILPIFLPAGIPLYNFLRVLSLSIHFGLAAIESFGAESADIDDAPVWAFAPLFAELSQTEDIREAVPGCSGVANLLSLTEEHLRSSPAQTTIKTLESISLDRSIHLIHNTPLAALALAEEQLSTSRGVSQSEAKEVPASPTVLDTIMEYVLGQHRGTDSGNSNHHHGRRRRTPLKKPPYYSAQLPQQFYALHNQRSCPENCLLCRVAKIASNISEVRGVLGLIKMLLSQLIDMFRDGESVPYVDYTFDIKQHTSIYQTMVKANQCLKLYQASASSTSSMSFDDRGKVLTKFGLNKVTMSLPSPTFHDLETELSMEPRSTLLYSLICKNFLYFLLQAGAPLSGGTMNEEALVKGVLEHMSSRGEYAGYAPNDLVDAYPSMCKHAPYTDHPLLLTAEVLSIIPIGRTTGILTFVPKANSTLSEHASYLCLIYPYPNSFVEQCARAVVREFIEMENRQEAKTLLDRMRILRDTASDLDFYDIGLRALKSLLASESTGYILYTLASIRVINYIIEMSEICFETITGTSLFDALLYCEYNQEGKPAKCYSLSFPGIPSGDLLLSPIEIHRAQVSLEKSLLSAIMEKGISLLKKLCTPYYRQEYLVACSSLLSEVLGIQLPLAYTMCLQPVALDPGERDIAFRKIEKQLMPLFWEATLITSFASGEDIQHHRCYMQFLKPNLTRHLFTPTFRHCVGFALSSSVSKSRKQEL